MNIVPLDTKKPSTCILSPIQSFIFSVGTSAVLLRRVYAAAALKTPWVATDAEESLLGGEASSSINSNGINSSVTSLVHTENFLKQIYEEK